MTREEAIAQLKMDRDLCNFNPMTGEEEPMNEDCRKSAEALDAAIKALEQEPRVDFKELKRKILMEVDGGTDDAWLAYGEVCNRISNSIDEFVADTRGEEE